MTDENFKDILIEKIDDIAEAMKKDIRSAKIGLIKDFSIEIQIMEDGCFTPLSILYNFSTYSESEEAKRHEKQKLF